ncbi:hypothetical protein C5E45_16470 [Nocardia nova]|uniref:DUF6968 domain-containing protein n=1 Tax=Nocardia nova TaxID=37330 RepID=A0A2S6APP1_9NOCA|nr:hypothetical protein [Nocardia nova]PPJ27807.1 hypothetical protein C5E41_14370 [Nocardia nova]PPJ37241.1 hypothetical protein C5E45_16470 [Nocardia nova]
MAGWNQLFIAQRELRRGPGSPILVSIGLPYKVDSSTWRAPVRIEGIQDDDPFDEAASGSDSVEALINSLKLIAAVTDSWNVDNSITWNDKTDLGFSPS